MMPASRLTALVVLAVVLPSCLPFTAPAAEDPPPAGRDHVLYMGLDVALEVSDQIRPVVGADHHAVQVLRDGRRVRVPIHATPRFRTEVLPKVSRERAELKILKAERSSTARSDSQLNAMAQQMVMQTAQSAAEEVTAREMRAAMEAVDGASLGTGATAEQLSALDEKMSAYDKTLSSPLHDSVTPGQGMAASGDRLDAYLLTFEISSAERVDNGYAIVRLFIRDPAEGNTTVSAMRFFRLPTFGPKPARVVLLTENLPPGFALDRHEIHIYTDGREIPSNLSPNRVELSRDEIYQFLLMQHMRELAGGDGSIEIIAALLVNDLRDHVPPQQMNRGVEVAVDASGNVTAVELDPVDWSGPDAYVESVIRQTRFFPAQRRGKPIADRAQFVLSEFIR